MLLWEVTMLYLHPHRWRTSKCWACHSVAFHRLARTCHPGGSAASTIPIHFVRPNCVRRLLWRPTKILAVSAHTFPLFLCLSVLLCAIHVTSESCKFVCVCVCLCLLENWCFRSLFLFCPVRSNNQMWDLLQIIHKFGNFDRISPFISYVTQVALTKPNTSKLQMFFGAVRSTQFAKKKNSPAK